jgi:hypothetical protein
MGNLSQKLFQEGFRLKKPAKRKPPFLSVCTVNFAVYKPLDFIGFTGTPFFKTAPNFDFYFFGGYFLVCGVSAP